MNQREEFKVPGPIGLYRPEDEHDACGIGFVADIGGSRSHALIDFALRCVCNLTHRGAVDFDARTGDGAGILTQIPHRLLRQDLDKWGMHLDRDEDLGVGMIFLPRNDRLAREKCRLIVEESLMHYDLPLFGWRKVPIDTSVIGDKAETTRPVIEQVLFGRPDTMPINEYHETIYLARKVIERSIERRGIEGFYIPSMGARKIVYKGMFVAPQLRSFYQDLKSPEFEASLVVFHQRYSTNTFPNWRLAQPFRMICHNGEINTLAGNKNRMRAREPELSHPRWKREVHKLKPIIQPGGSDSAALDNTLEAVCEGGRGLLHGVKTLLPPAWEHDQELDPEIRDYYKYHSCISEPWDGPAAIVFTDGETVGATLDRNGLRPARYKVTCDNRIIFGSEVGILNLPDSDVIEKGRLGPGRMIAVDTKNGRLLRDEDVTSDLASREAYGEWNKKHLVEAPPRSTMLTVPAREETDDLPLTIRQKMFGWSHEDTRRLLSSMFECGKEAIGSMGDDTPLAVLSDRPRPLHHFFKQRFAQVTNPPIDPIRESMVFSLGVALGWDRSFFEELEEHAEKVLLNSPVLTPAEMEWVENLDSSRFRSGRIDIVYDADGGPEQLDHAITRICREAEEYIAEGRVILVLSDRATNRELAPMPSLLAVAALHHHLLNQGVRTRVSIICESGEVRDPHTLACLLGYGASGVFPWLVYEEVYSIYENSPQLLPGVDREQCLANFTDAMETGLRKIMSKMGISTLSSYVGAQIFEAIGLNQNLVDRCFTGTPSSVSGVGLKEIYNNYTGFHKRALEEESPRLTNEGLFTFRSTGEHHAFNPKTVKALHKAVRERGENEYRIFADAINGQPATSLRDLLAFASDREPIEIDDVEPVESILRRFCTAAMSYGSLSKEAHETLAIAMNRIGGKSNSGEGGEDPARYHPLPGGDSARSAIKQIASARFGVTPEYLVGAKVLEIKMAQGSKPGEGGQLPGHKVTGEVARIRHSTPGVTLISPPPHHDIYSIEDLAQLICDLKAINPRARVCVKLVAEAGVGTIAAGVAKAGAEIIHISGHDGGTGASPLSSIKHAGSAWEIGLSEAHQVLVLNNMRGHVTLRADGGLRTGRDILMAALLGAEEYIFGTAALIATGCVMARQCHANTCPVGVATQREDLRKKYPGKAEHLVAYLNFVAQEVRELMASMGYDTLNELIGRVDLLKQIHRGECPRSSTLDLSRVLTSTDPERKRPHRRIRGRNNNVHMHMNVDDNLIQDAQEVIRSGSGQVELSHPIENTDRSVGARLAGEIAFLHGDKGLASDGDILVRFKGTAGQSFGVFCINGLRLHLDGEANDYVGKGMAGGEIVVRPESGATFAAEKNSIIGNTTLYGATGGELFARGRAGERFAVRNSGANAVVEGVGDHGCEYMTGGTVVVLGPVGRNFAAGMTGGLAFVYDEEGKFTSRCNKELVGLYPVNRNGDETRLRGLLKDHSEKTGSAVAGRILENWEKELTKFFKVLPNEVAKMEAEQAEKDEVAASSESA